MDEEWGGLEVEDELIFGEPPPVSLFIFWIRPWL